MTTITSNHRFTRRLQHGLRLGHLVAAFVGGCAAQTEPSIAAVGAAVVPAPPTDNASILGFEDSSRWTLQSGPATLSPTDNRSQGNRALAISSSGGLITMISDPLSGPSPELVGLGPGGRITIDVMTPVNPPNPHWAGFLQLYLDAPAEGIQHTYVGQIDLAGALPGTFQSHEIPISDSITQALTAKIYDDLRLTWELNVPTGGGIYGLDNVTFVSSLVTPERIAATGHQQRVFAYYKDRFGRNGLDGNGSSTVLVFGENPRNNASWRYGAGGITIGEADGVTTSSFAYSFDMMAHELTHGFINHTPDIYPESQWGAVNEAFADIMTVFAGADGDTINWQIGEDVWTPFIAGDAIRDLANPHRGYHRKTLATCLYDTEHPFVCGQPKHMRDYVHTLATGEEHLDAGILSHAAYLIVVGGTEEGTSIQGIGVRKAEQIYYRTLTQHLSHYPEFEEVRRGALAACGELVGQFGIVAQDCGSVANAFTAVGIVPTTIPTPPPGIHGGVTLGGQPVAARVSLRASAGMRGTVDILQADTDGQGFYHFDNAAISAALAANSIREDPSEIFTVIYKNPDATLNGRLSEWRTDPIRQHTPQSAMLIPTFDIADLTLTGPETTTPQTLPTTFTWQPRTQEREYYLWMGYAGDEELCNEDAMQLHSTTSVVVPANLEGIVCPGTIDGTDQWRVRIVTRAGRGLSSPRAVHFVAP